jgi:hypothetical protein
MLEVIYSLRMGKGINGSSASADAQSQLTLDVLSRAIVKGGYGQKPDTKRTASDPTRY